MIGGIFGTLVPSLGWERAFAVALGVQVVTAVLFWVLARRLRRRPRGSDTRCAPGVPGRMETIDQIATRRRRPAHADFHRVRRRKASVHD